MTQKQLLAAEKMLENGGNITKAMLDVGYSPASANNPQNLIKSKGFQQLKEQYKDKLVALGLNGEKLATKMTEWIDATKVSTSLTEPDRIVPDYQTQLKAADMLREDFGLKSKDNFLQQFNVGGEMTIEFT